jgi:hypothetical protein
MHERRCGEGRPIRSVGSMRNAVRALVIGAAAAVLGLSVARAHSSSHPTSHTGSHTGSHSTSHTSSSATHVSSQHVASSTSTHHDPSATSTTHHSSHSSASSASRDSHHRTKRSTKEKDAFKRTHPCPSTGKTSGSCPGYVIDHVQALKHGGADKASNMHWQTMADAKAKDKWE